MQPLLAAIARRALIPFCLHQASTGHGETLLPTTRDAFAYPHTAHFLPPSNEAPGFVGSNNNATTTTCCALEESRAILEARKLSVVPLKTLSK